jgi:hypothetical protein
MVCRAHAGVWTTWTWAGVPNHTCECWPCTYAYVQDIIAEARVMAGTVEMAPPFEE